MTFVKGKPGYNGARIKTAYSWFVIGLPSIQELPINISFRSVMLALLLSVEKNVLDKSI